MCQFCTIAKSENPKLNYCKTETICAKTLVLQARELKYRMLCNQPNITQIVNGRVCSKTIRSGLQNSEAMG